MGILDRFRSSDSSPDRHYQTFKNSSEYHVRPDRLPGTLLEIKPFKNSEGKVERGANLLQTLHDVQMSEGVNVSDSHSFEVWFDRGEFKFRLYASNPRAKDRFQRRVTNTYTNAEVYELDDCAALPRINEGEYIAGSHLDENRHTFLPIRHHQGTGFPHGDPHSDILGEMLTLDNSVVVLQVVFKPAKSDWTMNGPNGESVGDIAADLRSGTVVGMKDPLVWAGIREMEERPASDRDKRAADLVEDQRGKQGFHVNIRVLAISPEPREALERARGVSGLFGKVYSNESGQQFVDFPVTGELEEMEQFLQMMVQRQFVDREMILSTDELAGIAHIPNHEINVPQIPWKTTEAGSEVAAKAGKDERDTSPGWTDETISDDTQMFAGGQEQTPSQPPSQSQPQGQAESTAHPGAHTTGQAPKANGQDPLEDPHGPDQPAQSADAPSTTEGEQPATSTPQAGENSVDSDDEMSVGEALAGGGSNESEGGDKPQAERQADAEGSSHDPPRDQQSSPQTQTQNEPQGGTSGVFASSNEDPESLFTDDNEGSTEGSGQHDETDTGAIAADEADQSPSSEAPEIAEGNSGDASEEVENPQGQGRSDGDDSKGSSESSEAAQSEEMSKEDFANAFDQMLGVEQDEPEVTGEEPTEQHEDESEATGGN